MNALADKPKFAVEGARIALNDSIKHAIAGKDAAGIIREACALIAPDRLALASSLSIEDQVATHLLCAVNPRPRIFTLDTGRLFAETYETMEQSMERYHFRYEILAPDTVELEKLVAMQGPNLFYRGVELRKSCCTVRKTQPLARLLSTVDAWICGLRREQAVTRILIQPVEWDNAHGIIKINPLFDWKEADVRQFVKQHDVPYNPLQDRGFRSVGCAPCTRAIGPDDDVRAGRWWWEAPEHKECGLHRSPDFQI
jgi:phosphoadenosine phosphosulfate reductase